MSTRMCAISLLVIVALVTGGQFGVAQTPATADRREEERIPGIENGLQLSRNRFEPLRQTFSYEGSSMIPNGWQ